MVLLWPSLAMAAPMFSAMDPSHAEIARQAWAAATECAGWEAPAHGTVEIRQGFVAGGWAGGAWVDDDGLYRIEVSLDLVDRAIVHEVAHAWAHGGPAALTEGRDDLLADCIVRKVPGLAPLDPDPGTSLDAMPDLRRWTNPRNDHGVVDVDAYRRDSYLAAARFMRVVATVLPERSLWPQSGTLKWRDLERMLADAGPGGATVLAMLDGGVDTQRAALADADRDGQPWLAEVLAGTDPDRWDSDGDGWWDGSPPPPSMAAVPLPPDGTPVCAGLAGGSGGGTIQVLTSGELRGHPSPWIGVLTRDGVLEGDPTSGVPVPADRGVLLSLEGPVDQSTGGVWALVGGQGLVDDWSCRSTPRWTVRVEDPQAAPLLQPFADALDDHLDRADALLGGTSRHRLVVVLGTEQAGVDGDVVRLSTGDVAWALRNGRADALAGVAVAVHRVWEGEADDRRWDAAEALARAIVDDPPDTTFVSADLGDADALAGRALSCPDGWKGLLTGKCGL